MIYNLSSKPMYDMLDIVKSLEEKCVDEDRCVLCTGIAREDCHFDNCELHKLRKIIRSLECGDD